METPSFLLLHPHPQACGSLPVYAGVLGYGWGNRPICLGDVFDGNLGFGTLPNLLIALGNGPGIDFWNVPSSDYWTMSCIWLLLWLWVCDLPLDSLFRLSRVTLQGGGGLHHLLAGCLQSSLVRLGEGLPPCLNGQIPSSVRGCLPP